MKDSRKERDYWVKNFRMSMLLLALWLAITVGVIWFAEELNTITLIGPLGFYMAAQGAPICYLVIIWWYAFRMKKLDMDVQDRGDMRHGV